MFAQKNFWQTSRFVWQIFLVPCSKSESSGMSLFAIRLFLHQFASLVHAKSDWAQAGHGTLFARRHVPYRSPECEMTIFRRLHRADGYKVKEICHEDPNVRKHCCASVDVCLCRRWDECIRPADKNARKKDGTHGTRCDDARVCQSVLGLPACL